MEHEGEAASQLCHGPGLRITTYVGALAKFGPDATAVAVTILAERHAQDKIRLTAGASFAGMISMVKRDELDLAKTCRGFGPSRWLPIDPTTSLERIVDYPELLRMTMTRSRSRG